MKYNFSFWHINMCWCFLECKLNVNFNLIFHFTATAIGSAADASKDDAPSISSHVASNSSADEVIWCFVSEDISTDAPSVSAHTVNKSTSAGINTIDKTATMSSATPAISTGNTHSLSVGPTVNAGNKRPCVFGNTASSVSHGTTQPSESGESSSSSTCYRWFFSNCIIFFKQYCWQIHIVWKNIFGNLLHFQYIPCPIWGRIPLWWPWPPGSNFQVIGSQHKWKVRRRILFKAT